MATEPLSIAERAAALERMAAEGVDIFVVGGGITGAGVAVDAAARGYRVGLVEKGDFAGGTSSKSTKLVHGGIRYLPQYDFALVREALVERGLLVRNAPFLVQPIGFVLPLYAENKRPLGTPIVPPGGIGMSYLIQSGLLLYDILSGRLGVRRHRRLSKRAVEQMAPCLKTEGLNDAFIYYDAQTDDTRLTATVIRTAAGHGALVANYAEVTGFDMENGRIAAARVRDRMTGADYRIPTGTVVNAAGVWAGRIEALTGGEPQIHVEPAKGVHLTVPRAALKMGKDAIVLPETEDGRLLFIVPWGARVTIGTTDTEGGDIDRPAATEDDVAYILRHIHRYMQCPLTEADIISTWAGYRPLVRSTKSAAASSKLSRTHAVIDSPGGMVTIVGGKLTTYRRMAQDTVDHISREQGDSIAHVTERLPLAGTAGWKETARRVAGAAPRYGLRPDTVRRLDRYGAAAGVILDLIAADPALAARVVPDLPYIMAEVVYACRYEMALTLDDVLDRRLRVDFEAWDHGSVAAPAVAGLMARELGWDAAETARQVAEYRELVGRSEAGKAASAGEPALDRQDTHS
jgi:glycerol-3-phosphate dehydrogenase